jgi:hypothetical protein
MRRHTPEAISEMCGGGRRRTWSWSSSRSHEIEEYAYLIEEAKIVAQTIHYPVEKK